MPIHPSSHTRFIAETAPMRRVPTAFNFKKRTEPDAGSSFGGLPSPPPARRLACPPARPGPLYRPLPAAL
jgi:hypothetical protein